jgi:hypothetical protein
LSTRLDVTRILIEVIKANVTSGSRRKALIEAANGFEMRASKEEMRIPVFVVYQFKVCVGLIFIVLLVLCPFLA